MSATELLDPSIQTVRDRYEGLFHESIEDLKDLTAGSVGLALIVGRRHSSLNPYGHESDTHVSVLLKPIIENDPRNEFQEEAIENHRIPKTTTVGRMLRSQNGILLPSTMNQNHLVAGHLIEVDTHRIIVQAAFDRRAGKSPDKKAVQKFFQERAKHMGRLAAELAQAMGVGSRYERLFNIEHGPVSPNASVVAFDITASSAMNSLQSGLLTEWTKNFEASHVNGEFLRLQHSGDGAIYARYLNPEERAVPVGHESLPDDIHSFAEKLLEDYTLNCSVDTAKHPIRIAAANAFLDVVDGEETGDALWGVNKVLETMPRDRSEILRYDVMLDREGNPVRITA